MNRTRFANAVRCSFLVSAAVTLAACDQVPGGKGGGGTLRECSTPQCVEVTLRYQFKPERGDQRIMLLDPQTKQEVATCRICDPQADKTCEPATRCKGADSSTLVATDSLIFIQSRKSPDCVLVCTYGVCRERCS